MQPPQGLLLEGWTHPGSCNAAKPLFVGNGNRNPRVELQKTNTEGSPGSRFNLVKSANFNSTCSCSVAQVWHSSPNATAVDRRQT